LVILACNTASAKALRNIQQKDLPKLESYKRVLGVIRPTTEIIGNFTKTGSIGILGTIGTVVSDSYPIEIHKFFPEVKVFQQACPMWVPLIENGEFNSPGADYFVKKYLDELLAQSAQIDTILLACTHYPLLINKIKQLLPAGIEVVSQGEIVAKSLSQWLENHKDMSKMYSKTGQLQFFTTDSASDFDNHASLFFGKEVKSEHIFL
jgi:glutamate racemase